MRSISRWKKTMLLSGAAGLLAFTVMAGSHGVTAWALPSSGACASDNVVVRESAVSGAMVGGLSEGQEVSIQDETEGSDGKTWYKISYEVNGEKREGWVRSDLINETDSDSSQETGDGEEGTEDPAGTQEGSSVQVEAGNTVVTLTDVPEEEAAKISSRYVQSVCGFEEGSVTAYQLAAADELVSEEASLVDFYYVYGTDELGVSGWYVYDAGTGTLQRNITNLQYTGETKQEEESAPANGFEMDSITRMMVGVLAVVCLLLLVLTIIFSIRYRRLRRFLEDESGDDEELILEPEPQRRTEPKERKQKEKVKRQRTVKEKDDSNLPKREKENAKRSQMDDELEAILGEAQRQFSMELETPQGKVDLIDLDSLDDDLDSLDDDLKGYKEEPEFDPFADFDDKLADEYDKDYEFDKRELDDLERILSKDFSSQKITDQVDEEPDFYDDEEDDDLEFL